MNPSGKGGWKRRTPAPACTALSVRTARASTETRWPPPATPLCTSFAEIVRKGSAGATRALAGASLCLLPPFVAEASRATSIVVLDARRNYPARAQLARPFARPLRPALAPAAPPDCRPPCTAPAMATEVARAICELAAPAVRPVYVVIEASTHVPDDDFTVVLYVRPVAGGLEITTHHGYEASSVLCSALLCALLVSSVWLHVPWETCFGATAALAGPSPTPTPTP